MAQNLSDETDRALEEGRALLRDNRVGFDIACDAAGSGPRMQSYLVNDLCQPITAEKKQSDFALAA